MPVDSTTSHALAAFGVDASALLGAGGEAQVYALDERHVLRLHHAGASHAFAVERRALLEELAEGAARLPFAISRVVETRVVAGRIATVETRLPGRPLHLVLGEAQGQARAALVRAYLDAAARIGDLTVGRPWYGELFAEGAIRTRTFRAFLQQRAARSLAVAGPAFAHVDATQLARALPEPTEASLVHLDAFPGNMLSDGRAITAVLDFSRMALMGDRRLDPLTAAAYLDAAITPEATDADRAAAQAWLAEQGLEALYQPARRWIAAYWSFAQDDQRLWEWCRAVLRA